jgi:hypothetical protein
MSVLLLNIFFEFIIVGKMYRLKERKEGIRRKSG